MSDQKVSSMKPIKEIRIDENPTSNKSPLSPIPQNQQRPAQTPNKLPVMRNNTRINVLNFPGGPDSRELK